jgi:hypothetical protein
VVVQLRALADALELCCPNGPLVEESHC